MRITSAIVPASNRSLLVVCVAAFLVALALRLTVVSLTARNDYAIDLCIYMSGGQLITHGINPYDARDGVAVRQQLRAQSGTHNSFIAQSQRLWDYYAGGNLPLTLGLFGAVDRFFPANPRAYRFAFASVDALLAAFIVFFVFRLWNPPPRSVGHLALAAGLGVFSPVLLLWGAMIPEDKGAQVLLMLAALYFAHARRPVLGAVLLAASIAYKGLGVFIAPLCAWYVVGQPVRARDLVTRPVVTRLLIFTGLTVLVTLAFFAPFFPAVLGMMATRLSWEMSAASRVPEHGSIWVPVAAVLPSLWSAVRIGVTVAFALLNLVGVIRKRLSVEIVTASVLLLFVDMSLLSAGMDRMNMGLLFSILLVGICDRRWAAQLGWLYCIGGLVFEWFVPRIGKIVPSATPLVARIDLEALDRLLVLLILVCYTAALAIRATRAAPPRMAPALVS